MQNRPVRSKYIHSVKITNVPGCWYCHQIMAEGLCHPMKCSLIMKASKNGSLIYLSVSRLEMLVESMVYRRLDETVNNVFSEWQAPEDIAGVWNKYFNVSSHLVRGNWCIDGFTITLNCNDLHSTAIFEELIGCFRLALEARPRILESINALLESGSRWEVRMMTVTNTVIDSV